MNCDKCGQALPEPVNVFDVAFLRKTLDMDSSWETFRVGQNITEAAATEYPTGFPEGTELIVIATDSEHSLDSYGDSTEDAYVVFSVTLNGVTKNYKLEGTNSSYEGWDWQRWSLTEVSGTPKTITMWESI